MRLQKTVHWHGVHTNVPVRAGWLRIKAAANRSPRRALRSPLGCARACKHGTLKYRAPLLSSSVCSGIWLLAS